VLPRDVKYLLGVYGVEGARREMLLALAGESRQRGWWRSYGDVIPEWFDVFVGLESEAIVMRCFETQLIPGLLQTSDYTEAVLSATHLNSDADAVERLVELQMDRQELFTSRADGPRLTAVVDEAALHRVVGGPAVMGPALTHMARLAATPDVDVRVLPFGAGAHPGMAGAFQILGFPGGTDPDVAYVEYPTGSLYLEAPPEVAALALAFERLRATALDPEESHAHILRLAGGIS
jgi:hypothetical protein